MAVASYIRSWLRQEASHLQSRRADDDLIVIVVASGYVSAAGLAFLDECIEMVDANTGSAFGLVVTGEHTESHASIQGSSSSSPEVIARARAAIDPTEGRIHMGFLQQATGMMHSKTWAIGIVPSGVESIASMNPMTDFVKSTSCVVTGSANLTHGGLWGNEEEMTRPHADELPRMVGNLWKLIGESYPATEAVARLIDVRHSAGAMTATPAGGTYAPTRMTPTKQAPSQGVVRDLGCLPIALIVVGVIFIIILVATIASW